MVEDGVRSVALEVAVVDHQIIAAAEKPLPQAVEDSAILQSQPIVVSVTVRITSGAGAGAAQIDADIEPVNQDVINGHVVHVAVEVEAVAVVGRAGRTPQIQVLEDVALVVGRIPVLAEAERMAGVLLEDGPTFIARGPRRGVVAHGAGIGGGAAVVHPPVAG